MTLATGHWKIKSARSVSSLPPNRQGFSLLELLIVLVVIGVMISIASLSFRSFEVDPAEKELERLRYNVAVLVNEAIVRSEPFGIGFSTQGYRVFVMDDAGVWGVLEGDSLLKPHPFGKPLQATLLVGEEAADLSDDVNEPQVLIEPTGEMTPFALELASKDSTPQRLAFDALGQAVDPKASQDDAQGGKGGER